MVLVLCTSPDDGLYLYKVSWKYSRWYESYKADKIFVAKFFKRHNSIKNEGGVTVLVLCTWPDDDFYLYKVS